MKHAVSVSIGSSRRDKRVEITLLDEQIIIERIGTDGDMDKAANLYRELDGNVDAFEKNLIQRVAGLLFVSDKDRGIAKKRVMARLGIRG